MATPPRMLLLSGGGTEAFVLMPATFDVSPITCLPGAEADLEESPSCRSREIPNS